MTYSESAEGVIITKARALRELQRHGIFREEDIAEFLADCGDKAAYDAGDVLRWLGY
ncbi:hypothetical protein M3484_16465 [Pseudomonas sp. GX19020]|uniref:hypothetical protein n=1 Tax=Pseudomonas sp. GX19020 TaxID=2942277 RepID=UPI002018892F|nr:hypothetical protein [Pseudomonas sp. GX19020]MCL4068166.1 hypothetical protein [Pseudomonas sp. GX19020]